MRQSLLEVVVDSGRAEAMAREGMCPACRRGGFMGHGLMVTGERPEDLEECGTCLCPRCMTVWQYTLAARHRWN
jgi:hypothetical protein